MYIYIYMYLCVTHTCTYTLTCTYTCTCTCICICICLCYIYPTVSQTTTVHSAHSCHTPPSGGDEAFQRIEATGHGTSSGGNTDPSWWGWRDMEKEMETSGKKCENVRKHKGRSMRNRDVKEKTWIWSTKIAKGQARHTFYPSPGTWTQYKNLVTLNRCNT